MEWYNKFKEKLWEDDQSKVDVAEGFYIKTEGLLVDDIKEPRQVCKQAKFSEGVSYFYAA